MCLEIQFCILDLPAQMFVPGEGEEIREIHKSDEDRKFSMVYLAEVCRTVIYEEGSRKHAEKKIMNGAIINYYFTVWKEKEDGPKGSFFINLSTMKNKWLRGTIRMERIS